ncbi:MAG: methyltransferase domain-containing protein [Rhizobiaceae bacterium]|nr:methyltransferase domain-containing protein [Rhizobiaceae bacterium]
MSFSSTWLDLREPVDHLARDPELLARARRLISDLPDARIVDLGSGTGSTVRALDLPDAHWTLVDHDETLLAEARRRSGSRTSTVQLDLREVSAIPLAGAQLVTASALFDLVSGDWIDALVERMTAAGIGIYAALTYDGTMKWNPADKADAAVRAAFNRHQQTDKGLGPALGPQAADYLASGLRQSRFDVSTAPSPWIFDAGHEALYAEMVRGIATAAREAGCTDAEAWLERRLDALPELNAQVGHLDILALPPA